MTRKEKFVQRLKVLPNFDCWEPDDGSYVIVFWWDGNTGKVPARQARVDNFAIGRLSSEEIWSAVKHGRTRGEHIYPVIGYRSPREALMLPAPATRDPSTGKFKKGDAVDETGVPEPTGRD